MRLMPALSLLAVCVTQSSSQYITLITTVVTALTGGCLTLFGVYISNRAAAKRYEVQLRHEAEQRKQDLLRLRGEELHAATSAWLKRIFVRHLRFYSAALGNITYKQAQAQEVEDSKAIHDLARIELLIDAYFPSARKPYDSYVTERDRAEEIRLALHSTWGQYDGQPVKAEDFLPKYEKVHAALQESGEAFQKSIVACIRSL
jgi:hypothetical protein